SRFQTPYREYLSYLLSLLDTHQPRPFTKEQLGKARRRGMKGSNWTIWITPGLQQEFAWRKERWAGDATHGEFVECLLGLVEGSGSGGSGAERRSKRKLRSGGGESDGEWGVRTSKRRKSTGVDVYDDEEIEGMGFIELGNDPDEEEEDAWDLGLRKCNHYNEDGDEEDDVSEYSFAQEDELVDLAADVDDVLSSPVVGVVASPQQEQPYHHQQDDDDESDIFSDSDDLEVSPSASCASVSPTTSPHDHPTSSTFSDSDSDIFSLESDAEEPLFPCSVSPSSTAPHPHLTPPPSTTTTPLKPTHRPPATTSFPSPQPLPPSPPTSGYTYISCVDHDERQGIGDVGCGGADVRVKRERDEDDDEECEFLFRHVVWV
ncbi:hypothetical protein HK097_006319, partial [Rhizophlyctis rosea]